ncbi:hypothetical protein Ddye_018455 [Dipteronia dyeriana]|uniref:Uncharacterized protein n=1 Tax=Dipteronia dyeriana TaxID=168575 RepID=A0AAD9UAI7_9ROSI|nr:hypothetical protein Ddye_018455 [Dipteronia dyeriana]
METEADNVLMENFRVRLGFVGKMVVICQGQSGGLCLFWSDNMDVIILSYSFFHIDVQVCSHQNLLWRMTDLYGHPEASQRHHDWTLLKRFHSMSTLPWICAGDFIEILDDCEKVGGLRRPKGLMKNFRSTLDDCELQDLGYSGSDFT